MVRISIVSLRLDADGELAAQGRCRGRGRGQGPERGSTSTDHLITLLVSAAWTFERGGKPRHPVPCRGHAPPPTPAPTPVGRITCPRGASVVAESVPSTGPDLSELGRQVAKVSPEMQMMDGDDKLDAGSSVSLRETRLRRAARLGSALPSSSAHRKCTSAPSAAYAKSGKMGFGKPNLGGLDCLPIRFYVAKIFESRPF